MRPIYSNVNPFYPLFYQKKPLEINNLHDFGEFRAKYKCSSRYWKYPTTLTPKGASAMYLAYVYRLTHKTSSEFYIGYRFANIKQKIHPEDDLGKVYFTSSEYINRNNFHEFTHEILFRTLDTNKAHDYENKLILENWSNPLLLNRHVVMPDKMRFKVTEDGIEKLRIINKDKKWFNNGVTEIHSHTCPEGYYNGRLKNPFTNSKGGQNKGYVWYNNGSKEIMLPQTVSAPDGFSKGKLPASDITNEKISKKMKFGSAAAKGKKWYTNGVDSVLSFDCPDGWRPGHSNGSGNSHLNRDYSGYHWYNNGIKSKRARVCPFGFVPGRLS